MADARYTWLCLVPAAPPQNVYGFNISKHDIQVFWEEVPHRDVNGIILEYRVYFNETWDEVFNKSVKFPTTNTTLSFLRPYTFYSIQVLALTIKGDGPKSPPVIVRTEEEGKEQLQRCFFFVFTTSFFTGELLYKKFSPVGKSKLCVRFLPDSFSSSKPRISGVTGQATRSPSLKVI